MNIKDDLEKIIISNDFGEDAIKQVLIEQENLAKKLHILKVVSFADRIEKLVATDLFSKDNIETMQVNCDYDDTNNRHIVEFHLENNMGEIVAGYYDQIDHEQAAVLCSVFNTLENFDFDLSTEKLRLTTIVFELKPGIKEELLKYFLNPELKHIYDCTIKEIEYNNMSSELPINDVSAKRLKI